MMAASADGRGSREGRRASGGHRDARLSPTSDDHRDARLSPTWKGAILAAAILTPLGSTMIAVAVPAIARDLQRDPAALTSWLVLGYLAVGIAGQLAGGRLGDRTGHERALAGGLVAAGAGALLAASGASLAPLVAGRLLMAAGAAVTIPAAMALLRNGTPAARRGRVFATFSAAMGLAASVGPWLGGELVTRWGWRAVFLGVLPMIAAALPAIAPRALRARGTARAAMAPAPWIDLRPFRRAPFAGGALVAALHNLAQYALLFLVPVEIERRTAGGAAASGRVLLAMLLGGVVCAPLGARAAERFGARATVFAGSALGVAGYLLLPALAAFTDPLQLVPGLALLGIGLGLCTGPAQAAALDAAAREHAGAAAGLLATTRYVGGMLGIALLAVPLPGTAHWPLAGLLAVAASCGAALLLPGTQRRSSAHEGVHAPLNLAHQPAGRPPVTRHSTGR